MTLIQSMTKAEIQGFIRFFSKEVVRDLVPEFMQDAYFNCINNINIRVDGRMTTALGRFRYKVYNDGTHKPHDITISKKAVFTYSIDDLKIILKHESLHFVLCMLKMPHNDGDKVFEDMLKRYDSKTSYQTTEECLYKCTETIATIDDDLNTEYYLQKNQLKVK